jgi:hypothetical protein
MWTVDFALEGKYDNEKACMRTVRACLPFALRGNLWATLGSYFAVGNTFLFMTQRVKPFLFLSSLSFFLLLSSTILSLASNLITLRLLLARVCSISERS